MKAVWGSVALTMMLSAPAFAKDDNKVSRPKVYTDVVSCRAIADSDARLACFDAASKNLEDATEARTVVILDQKEVKKTKRSLFGFAIPNVPFFEEDEEKEEFKQIEGALASVQPMGGGRYQFSVNDAGTWQTTEASWAPLREGQKMKIKRGVAGSYMLVVNGAGVRVKRVN